jgi:hypothetical protein
MLADNGGPTFTRAPLAGSPVLDAGNPATPGSGGVACEAVDQRGVTRPQDGTGDALARCDIGAVESMGVPDPVLDFGDAPAPYPTLAADDGARHRIGSLFLGTTVSAEADGLPGAGADADDDDGLVFLGPFVPGASTEIEVTASEPGDLEIWWDFDQDGEWDDPGDQQPVQQGIPAGLSSFFIDVPPDAPTGDTYVRARISSVLVNPTGAAPDGEVEDYRITVLEPPFVRAYVGPNRGVALGGTVRVGATPAADGGVPPYEYSWSVDPATGWTLDSATVPDPAFTPESLTDFELCLTVADFLGSEDDACLSIAAFCADAVNTGPIDTTDGGFIDYWAAVEVTSSSYTVEPGGDVAFFAGDRIVLGDGFRVQSGGRFSIIIDPDINMGCDAVGVRAGRRR